MRRKTVAIILASSLISNIFISNNLFVYAASETASTIADNEAIRIDAESPVSLICDTEEYTVNVQRIFYERGNYAIEFMIQNHSDHDFNFGLDGSDIDGFQITIYSGGTCIAAGKKGVAKFHFREQDLTDYGINDFQVLNTTFSEFPFGTGASYPLQIQKDAFSQAPDQIQGAENTELLKTMEELKKQIEELKAENTSLKEQLSSSAATSDSDTPSSDSVSTTDNGNDQRLLNAILMCADVTNGNGTDVLGQRAYIVIPKEVLSQISENGYANFLENKIKNSGYNWFSIICDNGTGIVFSNSFTGLGTYGELDDEGCVTTPLGYISASESGYEYEPAN